MRSILKHKKFKQLASYSVQCLQKVRCASAASRRERRNASNSALALAGAHAAVQRLGEQPRGGLP